MKKVYLDNFIHNIENIREYIKHIELVNNISKNKNSLHEEFLQEFNIHLREFTISKKEFEYKAIIISLYGILENTISEWIQEHIENISRIVSDYTTLNENFRKEHFSRSINLIDLINKNRHSKFESINKESIVQKLNQIIIGTDDFKLNSEAYIPLSGNIKHSKIEEAFKPLDIDLNFLKNTFHQEIIKIDDLVGRRNDIAHGVQIDNILGITEFEDFISALQRYMINLFNILSEKEVEYEFKQLKDSNPSCLIYIDETKEVFMQNKVCIVNIKDTEIKIGDILFFEKNNKFLKTTLLSIKEKDTPIESSNNGELGLKLDTSIKKNSRIWKKIT